MNVYLEVCTAPGIAPERVAVKPGRGGETGHAAVAGDVKALADFVQRFVLQEGWDFRLEQVLTEAMDRADIHLCHAVYFVANGFRGASNDPFLQFGRGFVGKSEGDDVGRSQRVFTPRQQVGDALGQHFGLAGAGTSDDLQIAAGVGDGPLLCSGELHGARPFLVRGSGGNLAVGAGYGKSGVATDYGGKVIDDN